MDSLNSDCFLSTASFSERYFFSVKKNMDALISASTPFLMLVTGCNKLIHRKKNQMNPPLNLFSLPAERRLPEILWSVVLHNFSTITPQNPFPWLPHWFLCDVSHLETCPRLFRYHWRILYVLRIYLFIYFWLPKTSAVCVLFPWEFISFGFLVLLRGEPNLFYKQSLFYITETCVLTFRPRPFIYFLIQFPLRVTLFS